MKDEFEALYQTVLKRRENPQEGSYTCYLFDSGLDKILKKCGEECSEIIIAAKNMDKGETICEISDLIFHLTVLMAHQGISPQDVSGELSKRSNKTGNLKKMRVTDTNT